MPIREIGRVSPVITVLRQELRNRNTMRMVSPAPSSRVCLTLLTELRMPREVSRTTSSVTSAGKDKSTVTWSGSFKRKDTSDKPAANADDATATNTMRPTKSSRSSTRSDPVGGMKARL